MLAQQNRQEQIEKAKNSSGDATGDKNGNKDNSTISGSEDEEGEEATPWTENREDGSVYFF